MWIAAIQREVLTFADGSTEHRGEICQSIIDDAVARKLEIATSALALAEVCKPPPANDQESARLFDFWRQPYLFMVPLDTAVGQIARALMAGGYAGLKPPDATHIASAIAAQADELQTFDVDLLKLDGKVTRPDGSKLPIRKPELSAIQLMFFSVPVVLSSNVGQGETLKIAPTTDETSKTDPTPTLRLSAPAPTGFQRRIRSDEDQPDQS